jgi:hypothetical protein
VTIDASHSGQSDLVMTEEEQETFARHASLEDSFAQREDHGGKMPAQQKPALIDLCNDGKTPPPKRIRPTQHPSTMSTMGSYLTASNSNQAGSALLSTFNDVGSLGMQRSASLSAAEVEEIRCNNALTGFSRIEKINRSFMHNDKDPKSLTKTEKAQRKAAKACRNKITAVKKGGKVDIVDTMGEMVGRNEVTLSQGDNILTPNTAMVRFDRAKSSDSEESSDSDKKVVIFCSTTDSVLFYSKLLRRFKIPVCTMHSQQERHKFIIPSLSFLIWERVCFVPQMQLDKILISLQIWIMSYSLIHLLILLIISCASLASHVIRIELVALFYFCTRAKQAFSSIMMQPPYP